jgi:hypothetical protein
VCKTLNLTHKSSCNVTQFESLQFGNIVQQHQLKSTTTSMIFVTVDMMAPVETLDEAATQAAKKCIFRLELG